MLVVVGSEVQLACCHLPLRLPSVAFCARRTLGRLLPTVWGHDDGGFARLRRHAGQAWAFGGRREVLETGERGLLGICCGIGHFDDHQTIATTRHPSSVVWDMFAHLSPALVS